MDYTTWPEFQQIQTQFQTLLPSSTSSLSSSYPLSQSSYPTHYLPYPQNSNFSSALGGTFVEPVVNPPGVESYAPPPLLPLAATTTTTTHVVGHYEQQQQPLAPNFSYTNNHTHVIDPSSSTLVAAREAVRQYGADPVSHGAVASMPSNGSEPLAAANPNPAWWTNTATQPQPHGNGTWKKYPKKVKTKIVQSAYCEVCKIECTGKEVLDQHKLGKKHKKNVEKLRELLRPPQSHPPASSNPVIGPQLPSNAGKSKSSSGNKSKRKTAETPEELEKKKKKVLKGGAATGAVRTCSICNVVCNSETVYNYHLAGQKHAALVKKASQQHTQSRAT